MARKTTLRGGAYSSRHDLTSQMLYVHDVVYMMQRQKRALYREGVEIQSKGSSVGREQSPLLDFRENTGAQLAARTLTHRLALRYGCSMQHKQCNSTSRFTIGLLQ